MNTDFLAAVTEMINNHDFYNRVCDEARRNLIEKENAFADRFGFVQIDYRNEDPIYGSVYRSSSQSDRLYVL
jgi:hypothetical protein